MGTLKQPKNPMPFKSPKVKTAKISGKHPKIKAIGPIKKGS